MTADHRMPTGDGATTPEFEWQAAPAGLWSGLWELYRSLLAESGSGVPARREGLLGAARSLREVLDKFGVPDPDPPADDDDETERLDPEARVARVSHLLTTARAQPSFATVVPAVIAVLDHLCNSDELPEVDRGWAKTACEALAAL